jgi:histidine triad (HIT) family protein
MPPQGDQCIFCQLLANPEQTFMIHETAKFKAWLDINPRAKGHTMVVPKDHVESPEELGEDFLEMFNVARTVGEKAKSGLGADGYSIVVNDGEAAGQKMPHFYMIVFPRFEEDENAGTPTGAIFRPEEELDENDLKGFQDQMKNASFNDFQDTTTVYRKETEEGEDDDNEEDGESSSGFRRRDPAEFR